MLCKIDKNVFKFAFRVHTFSESPETLEAQLHEIFYFQHKTQMFQTVIFWSYHKLKIIRNVVVSLNQNATKFKNYWKASQI